MPKQAATEEKISTSFKVQKALHVDLKIAAAKEGREMGELVEDALRAYLKSRNSR
jgi:predicted HicB family RNase H-like nuclease